MEDEIYRSHPSRFSPYPVSSAVCSDKDSLPFFRWKGESKEPLVVFHPRLPFDPWCADFRQADLVARPVRSPFLDDIEPYVPAEARRCQVHYERYLVREPLLHAVPQFVSLTEKFLRLDEDECLWHDTGCWAAVVDQDHFIGVSVANAEQLIQDFDHGLLCYSLCHGGAILVFTYDLSSKREFSLDAYINNRFSPLAEELRMIRRSLNVIGSWESVGGSLIDEASLKKAPDLDIDSSREEELNRGFSVRPSAVVKDEGCEYHAAIVPIRPKTIPWKDLQPVSHILATFRRGNWTDDDFLPKNKYHFLMLSPYFLRTCVVLDCGLAQARELSFL
jgi:hypothetical protein